MAKELNWGAIATVNFDDQRRAKHGQMTSKELFAKSYETLQKSQDALARRKEIEPYLRNALLQHMVARTPITVLQPIKNPTETLGGVAKSNGKEEEDDGFYYNGGKPSVASDGPINLGTFQEVMEVIPSGIDLVFKSWDKNLGQLLFKGSNGAEYAIYEKSNILFQGQSMENPGLYGLLFQTSIINCLDSNDEEV